MRWFHILKKTALHFQKIKASQIGAALAYYTIFSATPLLIIAIAIAGTFFGEETAKNKIIEITRESVGPEGVEIIRTMLQKSAMPEVKTTFPAIIGIATLFIAALSMFTQLKHAMNIVWKIVPKPHPGFKYYFYTYFFSFLLVIIIGLILFVSLGISVAMTILQNYFYHDFPIIKTLWSWLNLIVLFALFTLLFAILFKILPDVYLRWSDMWPGALITSALFVLGKYAFAWYISFVAVESHFGAAGSLIVLLLWVYWSSQILLCGAIITWAYVETSGKIIHPKSYAKLL